ncbi:MAG: helix-turn-helix transcriptional regulator [Synergistaceae bacterium]|nr:helix-turn-helix transcriptional regulator [Synergistaceae bacterium]
MAIHFSDYLNERLKDNDFRIEYEAIELEEQLSHAIKSARETKGLTQQQLSERTGLTLPEITSIENGNANTSLSKLQRLVNGLGLRLRLQFV